MNVWDKVSVDRTVAHELGHLLLHADACDVTKTDEEVDEEIEADAFACHFLMLDCLFERASNQARGLGSVDRVFTVKRMFRVGWRTVLHRVTADWPCRERSRLWLGCLDGSVTP